MSSTLYTKSSRKESTEDLTNEENGRYAHLHFGSGMENGAGSVVKMNPSNSVITISFSRPFYLVMSGVMLILFIMAFANREPMVSVKTVRSGISREQFKALLESVEELRKEVKELRKA
ncbi:uncharacterized protein L201_000393 [Kwoniella dendrophila CBS 6074]|uniref:Transmembrane protein n=1 Tax=Kwoniella dendrophila CBS 6074 TaxID=1295534 RepID=A0AAX4JJB7_9TREE